jgi:hypothetical protein
MPSQKPRETVSVRRDAWRTQLLHEQVAAEMAEQRRARDMRRTVLLGIVLGVAGSAVSLCL